MLMNFNLEWTDAFRTILFVGERLLVAEGFLDLFGEGSDSLFFLCWVIISTKRVIRFLPKN